MGTTLTGTTPQDTYDSLIKVTDNGPLSATAKLLTDGLGNNSALALGTTQVGIGTSTLFTTASIAASLPATSIGSNFNAGILNIQNTSTANGNLSLIGFQDANAFINLAALGAINIVHSSSPNSVVGELGFYTKPSGVNVVQERMRITSAGNVGIGTSAPAQRLDISSGALITTRIDSDLTCLDTQGLIYTRLNNIGSIDGLRYASRSHRFVSHANALYATIDVDGLKFGSDTAAANALDDYEEGTFTASLKGSTTDPTTAVTATGRYTKIGNRVNYSVNFSNVNTTGASGIISVTGFPYTSNANQVSQGGVAAHTLLNLNGAAFTTAFVGGGSAQVNLLGTQSNGAWIDTIHNATAAGWLFISGTYEV